ncbi:hypothetical protein HDV06_004833 [Boothiomyces sp. JEL0866]|nr:hypothetical protein HDV06_004833 [Boothiomyces sp. JEL0866]
MDVWKSVTPFPAKRYSEDQIPDLKGKVALVTGGNTGVGFATCLALVKKGAKVYLAARSDERASAAISKIKQDVPNADIIHLKLDLQDLKQVKAAAKFFQSKESKLDILINNAGIMACPFALSKDGIETQFATNHVGHFLLTRQLLPLLLKTSSPRVVNLSSIAHLQAPSNGIEFEGINKEKTMSNWTRYCQSKLANILFSKGLHKRYASSGLLVNSVHPGWVDTEIDRNVQGSFGIFYKLAFPCIWLSYKLLALTPLQGALTSLYCATSPEIEMEKLSDRYFIPIANQQEPLLLAQNEELADKLWTFTDDLWDFQYGYCGLSPEYVFQCCYYSKDPQTVHKSGSLTLIEDGDPLTYSPSSSNRNHYCYLEQSSEQVYILNDGLCNQGYVCKSNKLTLYNDSSCLVETSSIDTNSSNYTGNMVYITQGSTKTIWTTVLQQNLLFPDTPTIPNILTWIFIALSILPLIYTLTLDWHKLKQRVYTKSTIITRRNKVTFEESNDSQASVDWVVDVSKKDQTDLSMAAIDEISAYPSTASIPSNANQRSRAPNTADSHIVLNVRNNHIESHIMMNRPPTDSRIGVGNDDRSIKPELITIGDSLHATIM